MNQINPSFVGWLGWV